MSIGQAPGSAFRQLQDRSRIRVVLAGMRFIRPARGRVHFDLAPIHDTDAHKLLVSTEKLRLIGRMHGRGRYADRL